MSSEKSKQDNNKKPFRRFGRKPEEDKKGIPMLKYGRGNNFYKFREALSQVAVEKYGEPRQAY